MPALVSGGDELLLQQIETLSRQGAGGVPALLGMFNSRSWTVRRAAVAALSRGDGPSFTLLARVLVEQRSHEPTIAGVVDALSGAPAAAEPAIHELLLATEPAVLCDAIQICGRRQAASAVPRLIELSEHGDDNVALAALEALGKILSPEATERLLAVANGDNFFRVFPAIDALGRAREPRALPLLQKLLKHPLYATEAARALGRIGQLAALGPLIVAMTTGPESLLRAAALALIAIQDLAVQSAGATSVVSRAVRDKSGPAVREKVTRALADSDGAEAVALGRILVWLANEESVGDFIALLGGKPEVAALALEGLGKTSALSDPRLLEALSHGDSELRARLLPSLMGVLAATKAVSRCLDDEQAQVRALACHVLARGNDISVVPRLFALLTDADLGVVHAAVGAIQSLGSELTERLALLAARSQDPAERRAGLRVVTYFGYEPSLQLCLEALRSDDERLRDIALGGLPALDDPRATAVLLEAAGHASPRTRASTARALGQLPSSAEVTTALYAALADADAWVRYYACQSLGRLHVAEALPLIVARLADDAGQVKMAAVEAIAAIPGESARAALLAAAGSDNQEVRRAAIVGIGERKDAELRPALLAALSSSDRALRLVAVSSIARFDDTETELEQAAAADEDAEVRRAALELLASRPGPAATATLLRLLAADPDATEALWALTQGIEPRIPAIAAELEHADDALARALLTGLSRTESRPARSAIDAALLARNPSARRAAARVLSLVLDENAKTNLARAASMDSDPEVRRISAAAIA